MQWLVTHLLGGKQLNLFTRTAVSFRPQQLKEKSAGKACSVNSFASLLVKVVHAGFTRRSSGQKGEERSKGLSNRQQLRKRNNGEEITTCQPSKENVLGGLVEKRTLIRLNTVLGDKRQDRNLKYRTK